MAGNRIKKKKWEILGLLKKVMKIATAFATASSFFHVLASETGDESNTAYANVLLLHATQLYNCSQSIEYTRYQSSVPTVKDVYASTSKKKKAQI